MARKDGGAEEFDAEAWQDWWLSTFPRRRPFIDERAGGVWIGSGDASSDGPGDGDAE